ncbi:DUF4214 domain-containing protein [Pseudoduganella sp. RAF53_2]|uniref:DUF4214 domain-containing protein n=1 Tax=unclassified Pseudoduganella TaxID=2637179 RepID=UPI003F9AD350
MSYSTIPSYADLTFNEMANATRLPLTAYYGSTPGYDNIAQYSANYFGAENHAVFSFTAVAGAVYSLHSTSYNDPTTLLAFDDHGSAIAEDDHTGSWGEDHVSFVAPYTGTFYVDASWVQGDYSDQQAVGLSILEDLATLRGFNIDGGPASENIDGTSGNDNIFGYGGNDSLFGGRGDDYLDGGAGLDEAFYNGNRSEYSVHAYGDRFLVTDLYGNDGADVLSNIERVSFKDMSVAFDFNGSAGEAYRLYQAAFNRTPDLGGLGFYIHYLDQGMSLESVANGFVNSPEFRSIYGTNPSNTAIITHFYENVLHREPEQAGLDYWVNILNNKQASLAAVLIGFSESQENFVNLIGSMKDGIDYIPYG